MKITIDRSVVEQALERLALYHHNNGFFDDAVAITALRAALTEPEPVQEPQRKPLSEEDIERITDEHWPDFVAFTRAVEAAHGIKE